MFKVLLIASEFEIAGGMPLKRLSKQISKLEHLGCEIRVLRDPTQAELEHCINDGNFDCALTTTLFSFFSSNSGQISIRPFNILKIFEQMDQAYIGSDSRTQLTINDKTVCAKNSGIGLPGITITRSYFEQFAKRDVIGRWSDLHPPYIVKPNTLSCSLGIDEDSITNTSEETLVQIERIFKRFPLLQEMRVEQYLAGANEYTVSILGNGDATVCSVVEILKENGVTLYSESQKKMAAGERKVYYELVRDKYIYNSLNFHSKRLFKWFHMRDMARFDFLYDGNRAYLLEINGLPFLSNSFSKEWQTKFDIKEYDLLAVLLSFFYYQQLANGTPSPLPESARNTIPIEFKSVFEELPNTTGVPESTIPNKHCSNVDQYTMVNRVSPESEVLQFLTALVKLLKPKFILETGTYKGATATAFAKGLMHNEMGKLVTIEKDIKLAEQMSLKCRGLPIEVLCIDSLSYNPEEQVDLLFLDSHRPIRKKEFLKYRPYLSKNALIVWHDSSPEHSSVYSCVEEFYEQNIIDRVLLPTPRGLTISMLTSQEEM